MLGRAAAANSGEIRARARARPPPQVYWAYLHTADRADSDPAIRARCARYFLDAGDGLLATQRGGPYLNAARLDVSAWVGWGAFTYGTLQALQLLMAWDASGRSQGRYREAAALNIDSQFGANPQSRSYVTGKDPTPRLPPHRCSASRPTSAPPPPLAADCSLSIVTGSPPLSLSLYLSFPLSPSSLALSLSSFSRALGRSLSFFFSLLFRFPHDL